MNKTLEFEWGTEKKVKISKPGHQDSLFYEGYRQALAGVTEILWASSVYTEHCDHLLPLQGQAVPLESCDPSHYNYPNNMIVFSGERGAGKSSAMLTFVNGLTDHHSDLYSDMFLKGVLECELPGINMSKATDLLRRAEFIPLPPIDPTALEKDGQIMPMILSRMLHKCKETWQSLSMQDTFAARNRLDIKNQLIQQFKTCHEHICAIKKLGAQHREYESLDVLEELGDSSQLKTELTVLVHKLLGFCAKDSSRVPYLVLQLDDTDVNVEQAYSILEDIRKYLVIPRLIIIMAANLEHLTQVIKNSFLKNYDCTFQERELIVENLAHQYMTKLFPQTRQINLPPLSTYLKEHAQNITLRYLASGNLILPDGNEAITDFQEQIFRLIFRKTGLIFLRHKSQLHYIIPDNMRLLSHFLSMLVQMQEVCNPDITDPGFFPDGSTNLDEHKSKLQHRLQNLQRFRDYFLNTWVPNNLDYMHARVMKTLDSIDVFRKVHFICDHLSSYPWNSPKVAPNYANMVALLSLVEQDNAEQNYKKFAFAVHTYFSLLGHCITIETLINCCKNSTSNFAESGCSFVRLYELYGSQVFPYVTFKTDFNDEQNPSANELDVVYYATVPKQIDPKTGKGHSTNMIDLKARWYTKIPSLIDSSSPAHAYTAFLYSLFYDYAASMNQTPLCVDLCTPIVNSLYLCKDQWRSRFAEECSAGAFNLPFPEGSWRTWPSAQNNALVTVLNWDVQRRVGETLLAITNRTNSYELVPFEATSFTTQLASFYNKLIAPFTSHPDSAIRVINQLNLQEWAESLLLYDISFDGTPEADILQNSLNALFVQNRKRRKKIEQEQDQQ